MPTDKTFCRVCEAACGLRVERDLDGAPTKLVPDRTHPVSAGFACAKGTRFLEVARHPERLLHPMQRRDDGTLARISWDDALRTAGDRLRAIVEKHGPHAVGVYYGNPLAFNTRATLAFVRFWTALGTRNIYGAGTQDCSNKFAVGEILHGSPVIHPIPDFERCELAVCFGTNPAVSQSSFVHLERGSLTFDRLVERGAHVVWVDPRRTESAKRWGEHLPIRAGTDVWLMLALVNLLADMKPAPDDRIEGLDRVLAIAKRVTPAIASQRTGIDEKKIRALANRIRHANGTALHMSVGVNQGPFGTLAYVAMQVLAYVSGNYDRAGGSVFQPIAPIFSDAMRWLGVGKKLRTSRIGSFDSVMDALPAGILADEILTPGDGQIRAMIVLAGDPLHSIPGSARLTEAFESLEFTVCIDMFENHTGRFADVLLPATSWLERWDLAATTIPFQLAPLIGAAGPVTDAPGETRHDAWILAKLARAMGRPLAFDFLDRADIDALIPTFDHGYPAPVPQPGSYLGRGPRTPGHRVRFWHARLEPEDTRIADALASPPPAPGEFTLISRRRRLGHNSWLHGGTRDGDAERVAWLSPDDHARLGLRVGDEVTVTTAAGSLRIGAAVNEGVMRGTVVVPHGLPDVNVNAIVPSGVDAIERVSGTSWMTGIPARVERVARAVAEAETGG
jgi:formate dehydrogenase